MATASASAGLRLATSTLALTLRSPGARRPFFASSTDHSDLLGTAEAHVATPDPASDPGARKYFLVPHGTDLDLALRVDKLQLAWVHSSGGVVHSVRVLQRTLGDPADVCGRLVDMALADIRAEGTGDGRPPTAVATLHGLCSYVEDGLSGTDRVQSLVDAEEEGGEEAERALGAVRAMATGVPRPGHSVVGMGTYRDGEELWRRVAEEFVLSSGRSPEGKLYLGQSGGRLAEIMHLGDQTRDGLLLAGGAVARFEFD